MILVLPAVAGAWALAGPGVVVDPLTVSGTVSGVGVERVGAVVDSRGPVVGVDADLVAGSAWTAGGRGWVPGVAVGATG